MDNLTLLTKVRVIVAQIKQASQTDRDKNIRTGHLDTVPWLQGRIDACASIDTELLHLADDIEDELEEQP